MQIKLNVMKIETESPSDRSLLINEETVEEISHYINLGATITTAYDDSKEIRERISFGKNTVSHTWKNKSITLKTKKQLLNTLVFPVATYGSECWLVKQSDRKRLACFELWSYHRILRVSWTEPHTSDSILELLKIKQSIDW